MPSSFVEVEIKADPDLVENLIGILSQVGFEGFWEDGPTLKCYIAGSRWSPSMQAETETTIQRMTRSSSSSRPEIVVRSLDNRNWNEEWEKTIKPIQVSNRIVIKPTWHEYRPEAGQIVLTIDPKMSFGTGYHETTRLVLKLMEKYVKPGITILDVGTGTGVLAIAGIKLGAQSAIGIDVDEWSGTNAPENVRLNHVENQVTIHQMELSSLPPTPFEMIVANIQYNVIVPMLPEVKLRLSPGGMVILSGLLTNDRDGIIHQISTHGLAMKEEMRENEWMALVVS